MSGRKKGKFRYQKVSEKETAYKMGRENLSLKKKTTRADMNMECLPTERKKMRAESKKARQEGGKGGGAMLW